MIPTSLTASDVQLQLRSAWPHSSRHAVTRWTSRGRGLTPGQWFADPAELSVVRELTPGSLEVAGVLLQPDGADRQLPMIADLTSRAGHVLVDHWPEWYGVIAHEVSGLRAFTNVTSPAEAQSSVNRTSRLGEQNGGPLQYCRVLHSDLDAGTATFATPEGWTLFRVGQHGRWSSAAMSRVWGAAGRAIRRIHDGPSVGLRHFTAADDVACTKKWLRLAEEYGVLPRVAADPILDHLFDEYPGPLGLLHGQLMDRCLYTDGGDEVGITGVLRLSEGERAMDIAQLLVCLETRAWTRRISAPHMAAAQTALITALSMDPVTRRRVRSYAVTARLRAAAVHAFRPQSQRLVQALLAACQILPSRPISRPRQEPRR